MTIAVAAALLFAPPDAEAMPYGIFDARTLAMGGASVASATSAHAMYYNPALFAMYDERKERSGNSRFHFPVAVAQVSDAAEEVARAADDDLDTRITQAVDAFNADPTEANALAVLDATADLDDVLGRIADEDLFVDSYVGLAIGVPDKREGGGFYLGSRLVGGGLADVTDADRQTLDTYIEGLTFIATGGAAGAPRPEIFDADGNLIDPTDDLTSTAAARAALISEGGVAISKEFQIFGWPIALGMTPKIMHVAAAEYRERVSEGGISIGENREEYRDLNLDVGVAGEFGGNFRAGLGIKYLYPRDYATGLGGEIRIRPQVRAGLAYQTGRVQAAVDLDLLRNDPVGTESASQEIGVGVEWAAYDTMLLRGGYRQDLVGSSQGIASVGLGLSVYGALLDLAYGQSDEGRVASLQFGFRF
jgi:hypothetical protein